MLVLASHSLNFSDNINLRDPSAGRLPNIAHDHKKKALGKDLQLPMAERSEVTIKGSLNNLGLDAYQHDTARNDLLAFAKEKLQEGAEDLINYDPWANEYIDHLRKMWKHPWVVNIMKSHSDAPDQAIQDISNIMFRQVKEQRRKWQNKKPSQKIASAPAKGGSETRNDADDSDNHDCKSRIRH